MAHPGKEYLSSNKESPCTNLVHTSCGFRRQASIALTELVEPRTSSSSNASTSIADPITSLCRSLEVSSGYLCGFLRGDDYRYYLVYQEIPRHSHCPKAVTLDQLLRKDGAPIPSRRQRVALGFLLASSFLQLLGSPWLQSSWQKSDIIFFEDPDRPGVYMLDQPHLRNKLEQKSESRPTDRDRMLQLCTSLEMLGVVLLELCFGQLLEEQMYRPKYTGTEDRDIKAALDLKAATLWYADVEEEAGFKYSTAVGWCLGGIRITPPDRWRETMLDQVVNSLESCHRDLQ